MGRPVTGRDKLKLFINVTWHNMWRRRDQPNRAVHFTRNEFAAWCEKQREHILSIYAFDKPSIDRIDPWTGYSLDNMQIIPFRENCRQGGEVKCINKTNEMEALYVKYCLACGLRLTRKQYGAKWEPTPQFKKRLTCGKSCSFVLRKRGIDGRMEKTQQFK